MILRRIYATFLLLICFQINGQSKLEQQINEAFSQTLENCQCKNAIFQVHSPSKNINLIFSHSNEPNKEDVHTNKPFYTASITKMFTAVSIGILKEQGKLRFEDPIHLYLPDTLTRNLHVLDNRNYSKQITIAHLLQHTSGLPDYFTDKTVDNSLNVINQLLMEPSRLWSPYELINFAKQKMEPHFIPGNGYHYTDTEYVLLALLIEKLSGLSLHEFYNQHIFKPLKMQHTYLNLKSPKMKQKFPVMKFYAADSEISSMQSLSADWGGGGLIATSQDLISFLKAYQNDQIIQKNTRLAMQNWVDETLGMEYGYGVRKINFNKLYAIDIDLELIGHTGSTASFLWYCPQLDLYLSGSFNQLEASKSTIALVYKTLNILENED